MSLWFAGNAVSSQLASRFALDASETGWLTTIVQLGFVAGTATIAMLNLADIFPSRLLFSFSAVMGAAANFAVLFAPTFEMTLLARFATGVFLAGVYPPAMKMISTWFVSQRGLAIGAIVGALTIGKATPFLVHSLPNIDVAAVLGLASLFAIVAAALVLVGYSDGPHAFAPRPFSWRLAGTVLGSRKWRLATASYLGHMFELYAFWTWIGAFLAAGLVASAARISFLTFVIIAIGGIGCVWGGLYADRRGRERLVKIALIASGTCCLASALMFGRSVWLMLPFALVWSFFVIADSAQFSALVTESVEPHAVGTALTLQTSLGFLLTMLPMQLVPKFASEFGWQWAMVFLALGPLAGIVAIRRLIPRGSQEPAPA